MDRLVIYAAPDFVVKYTTTFPEKKLSMNKKQLSYLVGIFILFFIISFITDNQSEVRRIPFVDNLTLDRVRVKSNSPQVNQVYKSTK